jgi:hypothetical protein
MAGGHWLDGSRRERGRCGHRRPWQSRLTCDAASHRRACPPPAAGAFQRRADTEVLSNAAQPKASAASHHPDCRTQGSIQILGRSDALVGHPQPKAQIFASACCVFSIWHRQALSSASRFGPLCRCLILHRMYCAYIRRALQPSSAPDPLSTTAQHYYVPACWFAGEFDIFVLFGLI